MLESIVQKSTEKDGFSRYIKHFQCEALMWREWRALASCKGMYVQRALFLDVQMRKIGFEFDKEALPLSCFSHEDLPLFVSLLPSISKAIQHCHDKGWVHGDIKPSNILYIKKQKRVRLIDFGASYPVGTCRQSLQDWQLTPFFASPGQRSGEGRVEVEDDWFALQKIIEQISALVSDPSLFRVLASFLKKGKHGAFL